MNAVWRPCVFLLLAVVGSVAGVLTNLSIGRATIDYEVIVNPGGATNALTCGFHVVCDEVSYPDANRTGLDWGNNAYDSVYWRSWGYKSVGSQGTVAIAKVWDVDDICYAVAVEVYSITNVYKGASGYVHTDLSGTDGRTFYISGSVFGAYTSYGAIGTTSDSEISGCAWTAAHLHQFSDVSGWFRNSAVYPDEDEEGTNYGTGWDLTSADNWQNRRPWSQ